MLEYNEFIEKRSQLGGNHGFDPIWMPEFLFDFQKYLVEWAIKRGRAAIFADCGLGKTPMQLVWAQNVVMKTNKPVLILTPLAVSPQTIFEANKFHVDAKRSDNGKIGEPSVYVTNYERLHYFDPNDFSGIVCDESSILKNFNGATKSAITNFCKKMPYRLLCTATAAPNDYIELGTSAEALGEIGYMDMLKIFFKSTDNSISPLSNIHDQDRYQAKWVLKGHAETPFWKWVCSWARALRKPSDYGFDDRDFILPSLTENDHVIDVRRPRDGNLFILPAVGIKEEREERKLTLDERIEMVARLVEKSEKALIWGHYNYETDALEKAIPGSVQVQGSDSQEFKEEAFLNFANNGLKYLITKPKIGAFGLNFQSCNHVVFFASHSYEQYYQGVRRCWRFGQKKPVTVDTVYTEGEKLIMKNIKRKSNAAERMFTSLIHHMNDALKINRIEYQQIKVELPTWLKV